jgi:hypothetical protein
MGNQLRFSSLLLITLLMLCTGAFAQQNTLADSSLKADTVVDNVIDSIPLVSLDGSDAQDAAVQSITSSGRGRDAFNTAAIFSFSPVHFHIRGYDGDNFTTYMNGVETEDLTSGYSSYSLWSGLTDETRNRYTTLGLQSNPFSFGGIGSSTFIDTRASKQRQQTSISFTQTNSLVKSSFSVTYSTGMSKKGWAFSFSGDRRYSDEGYVPGTYYNGWGYFAGIDKKIGKKQLLSLVVFGAPSESGGQGHATKESFALAGSNYYNPDWGYQNGQKRNAHVRKTNQPTGILTHDFSINKRTSLLTAVSYTFGEKSSSSIDWYDAPDPAPDYYSYLPSYQTGAALMQQVTNLLENSEAARQINWQQLYNVNRMSNDTIQNVDGVPGRTVSGHRSLYIVGERVVNTKKFNFNTTLNKLLNENVTLTAGLSYQLQKDNYFERVNDLLGGDFFVDVDQYAEQDFPNDPNASQNNVKDPNRIVRVGDKYGYNYDINVNKAGGWLQSAFHYKNTDFFIAGELSNTSFWRTGNVENGLFPDSSLGKSTVNDFTNYAVKAGITYKINRGSSLYFNAAYLTKAPYFQDAYLSPEIQNTTQENLRSQDVQTVEGGYVLNSPLFNLRLTGYYATFKHGFNVTRFFSYTYNEYIDYALSNINTLQFGGEFGAEAKVAKGLTVNAVASVGRDYYDSRQLVTIAQDNSNTLLAPPGTVVYTQNYRLPNTPQEAYSLGLNYRSRNYWYASLTGNYFDQMWVGINPDRRTALSVQGVDSKSALWGDILDQEKYAAQFVLDFRAGHSWKLSNVAGIKKPLFLSINAGVNNLLNNQNIISNGYENGRTDKFPTGSFATRYTYAEGINYFIKATLRFY